MPSNWEGVAILLSVTLITLFADYVRRRLPPPRDKENYVPPEYPVADDYVQKLPTGYDNGPTDDEATGYVREEPYPSPDEKPNA